MDAKFYLVNVPGKHGYSFMVKTSMTNDDAILEACANMDLFSDADDFDYANVSDADDHDVEFFKEYTELDS